MKKVMSAFASIALVASSAAIVPVSTASAQGASNIVDLCKTFAEAGFFKSVGQCMGTIRKSPPRTCKILEDIPGVYDANGWRNRGDCVKFIRALQNDF